MSAIVFGRYHVIGDEGADFQPGARVLLDPYDGFFDEALDAMEPGAELFFLLSDPKQLRGAKWECRVMRERLDEAPMITGKLVENGGSPFVFEVHKRETFLEVVGRKPLPLTNEAVIEVARYKALWEQIAESRRQMGSRYRFRFVCGLPSVSSVEEALCSGFQCSAQTDFGDPLPRITSTGEFTEEPPGEARLRQKRYGGQAPWLRPVFGASIGHKRRASGCFG